MTSIGVDVKLGQNVKQVAQRLQARYPGIAAITEPGQAIKVDTSSRLIISTGWIVSILALIVGGIGVTNTMAMSVFERTREIGILRAVGWPSRGSAAMIVSEAVGICLIALGVGCALGVVAAQVFVAHSALAGLISPSYTAATFAWGLAFALGVGLIGALYPTWRAVSLSADRGAAARVAPSARTTPSRSRSVRSAWRGDGCRRSSRAGSSSRTAPGAPAAARAPARRSPSRARRSARRRAGGAARWRAPCAIATRCRSPPERTDGRASARPPSPTSWRSSSARVSRSCRGRRPNIAICTFSDAVSVGRRLWAWNTKPTVAAR